MKKPPEISKNDRTAPTTAKPNNKASDKPGIYIYLGASKQGDQSIPVEFSASEMKRIRICAEAKGITIKALMTEAITAGLQRLRDFPPCPFCARADMMRETEWTHEHRDGSEYIGPALICDRCDAIAPKGRWLLLGTPFPLTAKH